MKFSIKITVLFLTFITCGILLPSSQSYATTLDAAPACNNSLSDDVVDYQDTGTQGQDPGGPRLRNDQPGHVGRACGLVSDTNGVFDGKLKPEEEFNTRVAYFKNLASCLEKANGCYSENGIAHNDKCFAARCRCHKDALRTPIRCLHINTGSNLRRNCPLVKRSLEKGGAVTLNIKEKHGHSVQVKIAQVTCPKRKSDPMIFTIYENGQHNLEFVGSLSENGDLFLDYTNPKSGGGITRFATVHSFDIFAPR